MSPTTSVVFGYIFTTVLYTTYWAIQRNKLRKLNAQRENKAA